VTTAQSTARRIAGLSALRPKLALVLGSSFQRAVSGIQLAKRIPYRKLPGFARSSVCGHAGELLLGKLGGTPVLVLSGRAHFYEGHDLAAVTFPMRVLAELGVKDVLLTNAAGGINRRFRTGDFMVFMDHINFMGTNPLRGPVAPGRERFVDLTCAYDERLNELLRRAARSCRVGLQRGVYLAVCGPSYETPAEIRAFAKLGADAVGMSTVPEAIVARQCGLNVAALSCITNQASGLASGSLSHEEVLEAGGRAQARAARLLETFARFYAES
jgi:purine-nucleoside phosphorylase